MYGAFLDMLPVASTAVIHIYDNLAGHFGSIYDPGVMLSISLSWATRYP